MKRVLSLTLSLLMLFSVTAGLNITAFPVILTMKRRITTTIPLRTMCR